MYDRQDFAKLQQDKADNRVREAMPQLRMIQQVAPVMQKLVTTAEHWNKYLEFLSAQVERLRRLMEHAQSKLADPAVWEYTSLAKLKGDVLRAEAMLDAFEFAMQLPKAIIDDAGKVDVIISQFEAKDEATG